MSVSNLTISVLKNNNGIPHGMTVKTIFGTELEQYYDGLGSSGMIVDYFFYDVPKNICDLVVQRGSQYPSISVKITNSALTESHA
jgi:hypothetical protein